VVDDHEISLRHTVKALRQVTGLVKQARNAREAMELALDLLPNLIFMDIHLPETCGLSLLGRIRKAWPPDTPRPAFVILTGDNSADLQQRLEQAAVSSVLVKPVQAESIRAIAARLLQLDRGVREDALPDQAKAQPAALRNIFLEELEIRLPELDRSISGLDWITARSILHQLIASSAMCKEKDLEYCCRQLYRALDKNPGPRTIVQAYCPFLQAADGMRFPAQA